jgi:hypothetical protein
MTREGGGSSYSSHMRGVAESSCYGIITCSDTHSLRVFWPRWSKIFSRFARQATNSAKKAIWFTTKACYYERLPLTYSSVIEEYYPKQAIIIMSNIKGFYYYFYYQSSLYYSCLLHHIIARYFRLMIYSKFMLLPISVILFARVEPISKL